MKGMAIKVDKKWQAESDLRTLADAEEIKADKGRMAACREMAKEKMMVMSKMAGMEEGK